MVIANPLPLVVSWVQSCHSCVESVGGGHGMPLYGWLWVMDIYRWGGLGNLQCFVSLMLICGTRVVLLAGFVHASTHVVRPDPHCWCCGNCLFVFVHSTNIAHCVCD